MFDPEVDRQQGRQIADNRGQTAYRVREQSGGVFAEMLGRWKERETL